MITEKNTPHKKGQKDSRTHKRTGICQDFNAWKSFKLWSTTSLGTPCKEQKAPVIQTTILIMKNKILLSYSIINKHVTRGVNLYVYSNHTFFIKIHHQIQVAFQCVYFRSHCSQLKMSYSCQLAVSQEDKR